MIINYHLYLYVTCRRGIFTVGGNNDKTKVKSLEDVAAAIKNEVFQNIVVVAGAGISTPSGIPDFRQGHPQLMLFGLFGVYCSFFKTDSRIGSSTGYCIQVTAKACEPLVFYNILLIYGFNYTQKMIGEKYCLFNIVCISLSHKRSFLTTMLTI